MEWDKKVVMCQLGNKKDYGEKENIEFQDYVLKNIDDFDAQSWEMFMDIIDLLPDQMKKHLDFWSAVFLRAKQLDLSAVQMGWTTQFRLSVMTSICDDIFKGNQTTTSHA